MFEYDVNLILISGYAAYVLISTSNAMRLIYLDFKSIRLVSMIIRQLYLSSKIKID